MADPRFIPALSFPWLTPLYDPLLRWAMREERFKRLLIQRANLQPNHAVLDLGCGTGTLTLWLQQAQPAATIMGLDIDPAILAIAQRKPAPGPIAWVCASATQVPYAAESFDQVVTSLMFHHLPPAYKAQALIEIYRILRPGGQLSILDFGQPRSAYGRTLAPLLFHLEEVADHLNGQFSALFSKVGLVNLSELSPITTIVGDLSLYTAQKPH
jgi:ubiquinone/menaquinone biosynthesis C-methylase UbiE